MEKIALFPGHTGKDSGAVEKAYGSDKLHSIEAGITLCITHKAASIMELMGIPYAILMGQFDARIGMSEGSVCGVSIHADISSNSKVRGHHCIYYPGSSKGKSLANSIDDSLSIIVDRARKVHSNRTLAILKKTAFPCVLVEVGFLSNQIEEAALLSHHYQHRIAFALVDGIRRWLASA